MLRASLSKRESSICAFCQHRLSLRTATPRNRRQLSGTRSLKNNDGWGSWGGGWGSQAKAPAQSEQDDFLDPTEIIARKKLLEKQKQQAQQAQAQAQQAQKTPEPPKPRVTPASLGPRYVWNVEKQQAVENSFRRDPMGLRNNIRSPTGQVTKRLDISPFSRKLEENNNATSGSRPVRSVPTTFNSTNVDGDSVAKSKPRYDWGLSRGSRLLDNNSITPAKPPSLQPQSLQPQSLQPRPFQPRPLQPQSLQPRPFQPQSLQPESLQPEPLQPEPLQPEPSQPESSQPEPSQPEPPQPQPPQPQPPQPQPLQSQPLQPSPSSRPPQTSQPPQPFKNAGDSDWGMLARKLPPDSENFWATLTKNGKDQDGTKSQASNAAAQVSGQSKPQDLWNDMESQLKKASEHKDTYDWGVEFDKNDGRQAKRPIASPKEKPQEPAPLSSQAALATEQEQVSKGQDWVRDRGNERRLSRFELGEDDSSRGREKKRRRGQKQQNNDDDEEGFDYEDYMERRRMKARLKAQREAERAGPIPIRIPELINIKALAQALKVEPKLFLTQLAELGFEGVSLDSLMAGETAALVAQEYGFEPTVEAGEELDLKPRPPPEDPTTLPLRPPVVTIMGHVDHGKTTLLDYLRKSSIAAQEHGGITQRIGAFSVKLSSGKPITFLDTPGHAAFLTMRQRGAYVTDIVVLVVAADDSVMPQTIEAIKHARAARVPMIVAINKIDKDGARIDQVKNDLAQQDVEIEDFGGDVQVVCVSGKTGQGMDDLEENILTLSEILDHRAEVDGPAEGWILESSLKPIGKAATVLVKRGTMRIGDYIAAGLTWAKIRHIRNEAGVEIDEALPGTPVEILGWKDLPAAGDQVIQGADEGRVKTAVEYREGLREREKDAAAHEEITEARKLLQEKRAREKELAEAGDSYEALPEEENGTKMVNFAVKGDLHGSVEAVEASILELGSHEVRPRILRSGTGPIHEFDVEHAAMSKSVIVNFATTTPAYIKQMAEEQGVKILDHTIIYRLVDDVKSIMSSYLAPEVTNKVLGEAEVLEIFPINIKGRKYKNIAGCRVRNGTLAKGSLFRVTRRGETIFDGNLETLKHLKKDVTEVKKGTECGIGFDEFQDFEVGDQIQAYEKVQTARFF